MALRNDALCHPFVCLFVCLSVCPSVAKMRTQKRKIFFKKLIILELWSLLTTNTKSYMRFTQNPLSDGKPRLVPHSKPP